MSGLYALTDQDAARIRMYGPVEAEHPKPSFGGWESIDIVSHRDDPPELPEIAGLIYPGRRTLISGPKEAHKTWLVACAAAKELKDGRGIIWIDLDDMGPRAMYERFHALGVHDRAIQASLFYVRPESRLGDEATSLLLAWGMSHSCRLAVVDSFTGILRLHSLKQESGVDIDLAWALFDQLAHAGIAPCVLDHVVKNAETRGDMAIGSERKDSAAWAHLSLRPGAKLTRGGSGESTIIVSKDRGAFFPRPSMGRLVLESDDDGSVSWEIGPDTSFDSEGNWRPTHYMEQVSRYVEMQDEQLSRKKVRDIVGGNTKAVLEAIDCLVREGYIAETIGAHNAKLIASARPYREQTDPLRRP